MFRVSATHLLERLSDILLPEECSILSAVSISTGDFVVCAFKKENEVRLYEFRNEGVVEISRLKLVVNRLLFYRETLLAA